LALPLLVALPPLKPAEPLSPLAVAEVAGVADDLLSLENMLTCLLDKFRTAGAAAPDPRYDPARNKVKAILTCVPRPRTNHSFQ